MPPSSGRLCAVAVAMLLAAALGMAAQDARPAAADPPPKPPFDAWLADLRAEAAGRGVSPSTLEAAFAGVELLPVVVERDRTQAELTLTVDQYLRRRLTPRFVRTAQTALRSRRALLRRVEDRFGVPGQVVASIWGLESNFGRFSGIRPTIPALATLAYDGRRVELFRAELLAALVILEQGDVSPDRLRGSWAGALGQPQFMPSTFLRHAVDFDGDGRRDIWSSEPDVLGSIANYLQARGWTPGERWGREVRVSEKTAARIAAAVPLRRDGGCSALRTMTEPRPLPAWGALGVRLKAGSPLPASQIAASLVRVDNRAFLVYGNYEALLGYNCAHAYAISVGMLSDQIG